MRTAHEQAVSARRLEQPRDQPSKAHPLLGAKYCCTFLPACVPLSFSAAGTPSIAMRLW